MSLSGSVHQLYKDDRIDAKIGDTVSWRKGKVRVSGVVEKLLIPGESAAELRPEDIPESRWKYPKFHWGEEMYLNDHRILVAVEAKGKKTYFAIPTHRVRQYKYQLQLEVEER